jgi:hypothetical protein
MEKSVNPINLYNTNFAHLENKKDEINLISKIEEVKPVKIISKKDNTILKFDYDYENKIFMSIKESADGDILSTMPFVDIIRLRNI